MIPLIFVVIDRGLESCLVANLILDVGLVVSNILSSLIIFVSYQALG